MSVSYAQGIKADPDIFISHTGLSKPPLATNQSARTKVAIDRFSNEKKSLLFTLQCQPLLLSWKGLI